MSRDSSRPFLLFSLALHALLVAVLVTQSVSAGSSSRAALALARPPETVNFRFVELPEGASTARPERAELVAERDARAADHGPRDLPEGAPLSEGRTTLPSADRGEGGRAAAGRVSPRPAPPQPPSARASPPAATSSASESDGGARQTRDASEREELATPTDPSAARAANPPGLLLRPLGDRRLAMPRGDVSTAPPLPPLAGGARGLPQVDNRLSRARYDGEFSLSTYEWDYAPYMRRLKSQIEEYTWTILPSAFWYGIAAWATQVRFVILPSGQLQSVIITGHDGVLELRHVARDAVSGAADFEPLPPGFPDPTLTVTGNFYFNVLPPPEGAAEAGADDPRDRADQNGVPPGRGRS